jgi:hypothetical protein
MLVDAALDLVESGASRFEQAGATVARGAEDRLTGQLVNGHCRIVPRPMGLFARRSPKADPPGPDPVFGHHLGAIIGRTDDETAVPPGRAPPLRVPLP